jgi:hypothetical protein
MSEQQERRKRQQRQQTLNIPVEKVLDVFLHGKQFEQHYATQESVDNLKEKVKDFKTDVDRRFDVVDRKIDKLEAKFDRLQWFLLTMFITMVLGFFKESILRILGA